MIMHHCKKLLSLPRKSDFNAVVIVINGFLVNGDAALNTLVSIFVTVKVVDAIYTEHAKLTLMIITDKCKPFYISEFL